MSITSKPKNSLSETRRDVSQLSKTFGYDPLPWCQEVVEGLLDRMEYPFEVAWRGAIKAAKEKGPHWYDGLDRKDRESVSIGEMFRDECKRAWKGEGLKLR
jgi:hypothetical protein